MDLHLTQHPVINIRRIKGLDDKGNSILLTEVNMEELCDLGIKILLRIMKYK